MKKLLVVSTNGKSGHIYRYLVLKELRQYTLGQLLALHFINDNISNGLAIGGIAVKYKQDKQVQQLMILFLFNRFDNLVFNSRPSNYQYFISHCIYPHLEPSIGDYF